MTHSNEQGAFWRFSLRFYDDEHVQRACLSVQEACRADVNLVLYLLFRARDGSVFKPEAIATLDRAITSWRDEIVIPLRALRTRLKPLPFPMDSDGQQRLRNVIKKAELDAEKLEQFFLESLAPSADATLDLKAAARASLTAYAACLECPLPAAETDTLIARMMALPSRI